MLEGKGDTFGMHTVLALLEQHPYLEAINANFRRNEGYEKSVRNDALSPEYRQ